MKQTGFALALILFSAPAMADPSLSERYPAPWREPTSEVMVTLGRNSIKGCGEFYQRQSAMDPGEYLVACTRDGEEWRGYLVWIYSENVTGPLTGIGTEIAAPY